LEKPRTELVDNDTFEEISVTRKVVSYKIVSDHKLLVSYLPTLDNEIIKSHNLDIVKIADVLKDSENDKMDVTSIPISAAVTAYARIHISKIKLDILKMGGKIYYSNTDSIVTDIQLSDNYVSNKELGKLKLEHEIKDGIFISGKK